MRLFLASLLIDVMDQAPRLFAALTNEALNEQLLREMMNFYDFDEDDMPTDPTLFAQANGGGIDFGEATVLGYRAVDEATLSKCRVALEKAHEFELVLKLTEVMD